jgi:hypothetical protein
MSNFSAGEFFPIPTLPRLLIINGVESGEAESSTRNAFPFPV